MAGQRRRKKRTPSLMGSHQRCWLWGRHVVLETLRAGRWPIVELRIDGSLINDEAGEITSLAAERDIPVTWDRPGRMTQLCGASDHQGLLAKMRPFPYGTLEDVMSSRRPATALVILDSVQDPYNFGAIIRAADVLGMDGVIVGENRQAEVSSLVARSSAGAVNHLPIVRVVDLIETVRQLRRRGYHVLAADSSANNSVTQQNLKAPVAFVMGNENVGVSPSLIEACDATVGIPQAGHVASLNVAVAGGILFYELQRQREAVTRSGGAI